jgi:hypothetical protein
MLIRRAVEKPHFKSAVIRSAGKNQVFQKAEIRDAIGDDRKN